MKTLGAVLSAINKPLSIEELTIPELDPGQVLVKVAYSGVCHSQLNEIQGLKGEDKFLPHTFGHEGSGVIEMVGPNVKKVKVGDNVVLTWLKGEGADIRSAVYERINGEKVNSGPVSTFLTRAVISENRVVKIPNDMPLREAALLGCAIPTGAGIIINNISSISGSKIAIFGIGGIGQSSLLMAKIMGASLIIVVDVVEDKLKQAIQLGATHVINAKNENVLSKIYDITNNRGVDYAIECAGRKESMELSFRSVRDNGGLCVIAGNLPKGEEIMINPFDLIKGKRIIGTWGGATNPDKDIPKYVDMFISGKLKLNNLISHTFKLDQINEAFGQLQNGVANRILITMAGDVNY